MMDATFCWADEPSLENIDDRIHAISTEINALRWGTGLRADESFSIPSASKPPVNPLSPGQSTLWVSEGRGRGRGNAKETLNGGVGKEEEEGQEDRRSKCFICLSALESSGVHAVAPQCTVCGKEDLCFSCVKNVRLAFRGEKERRPICLGCIEVLEEESKVITQGKPLLLDAADAEQTPATRLPKCTRCGTALRETGALVTCSECHKQGFCVACVKNVQVVSKGEDQRRIRCLDCIEKIKSAMSREAPKVEQPALGEVVQDKQKEDVVAADEHGSKGAGMSNGCISCETIFQRQGNALLTPSCSQCHKTGFCLDCLRNVAVKSRQGGEGEYRVICFDCLLSLRKRLRASGSVDALPVQMPLKSSRSDPPPLIVLGEAAVEETTTADTDDDDGVASSGCLIRRAGSRGLKATEVVAPPTPVVAIQAPVVDAPDPDPSTITMEWLTIDARRARATEEVSLPPNASSMRIAEIFQAVGVTAATREGYFLARYYPQLIKEDVLEYLTAETRKTQLLAFVAYSCDLRGLDLELALRKLVQRLQCLPGDGQKKARLISAFSEKYFRDNASQPWLANVEAVISLTTGIFMIQTTLHNQNVSKDFAITLSGWLKQNAWLNGGNDFDRGMLLDIYETVRDLEIAFVEDPAYPNIVKHGWVLVKNLATKFFSRPHRMWAFICGNTLYLFETPARGNAATFTVSLDSATERTRSEQDLCITLRTQRANGQQRVALAITGYSPWAYKTWADALDASVRGK